MSDESFGQCSSHLAPIFETDLEDLSIVNAGNLDQIQVRVDIELSVLVILDETEVGVKEVAKEECEILDELLILIV